MRHKLKQTGIAPEGYPVVSGVFIYVGSMGLPLEIILQLFKEENIVVNWIDYITDSMNTGTNFHTVKSQIETAVGDVYGPEYRKELTKRLNILEAYHDR